MPFPPSLDSHPRSLFSCSSISHGDDDTNAGAGNALVGLSESHRDGPRKKYFEEPSKYLGWMECLSVCQSWRHIIFYVEPRPCGATSSSIWVRRGHACDNSSNILNLPQKFVFWATTKGHGKTRLRPPSSDRSDLSRADRISLGAVIQSDLIFLLRGFRFRSIYLKSIELTVPDPTRHVETTDAVPLGVSVIQFPCP